MLIGILIGIAVVVGLISVFGGVLKKVMEIVSLIAKLCMCGGVAMALFQLVGIQFDSGWKTLLFAAIGAAVMLGLLMLLSSMFRLVGYSINYLTCSIILLLIVSVLGEKVAVSGWLYALLLLLFLATTSEYSHTEYSFWSDTETWVYNTMAKDWWENSEGSWRWLPAQIVFASLFYIAGSMTMLAVHPIEKSGLAVLFTVAAAVVNVAFDYFVLRWVEENFLD